MFYLIHMGLPSAQSPETWPRFALALLPLLAPFWVAGCGWLAGRFGRLAASYWRMLLGWQIGASLAYGLPPGWIPGGPGIFLALLLAPSSLLATLGVVTMLPGAFFGEEGSEAARRSLRPYLGGYGLACLLFLASYVRDGVEATHLYN